MLPAYIIHDVHLHTIVSCNRALVDMCGLLGVTENSKKLKLWRIIINVMVQWDE